MLLNVRILPEHTEGGINLETCDAGVQEVELGLIVDRSGRPVFSGHDMFCLFVDFLALSGICGGDAVLQKLVKLSVVPEAGVGVSFCHRVQHAFRVGVVHIPVGDGAVHAAVLLHVRPCGRVNLLYFDIDAGSLGLLLECGGNGNIPLVFGVNGYS